MLFYLSDALLQQGRNPVCFLNALDGNRCDGISLLTQINVLGSMVWIILTCCFSVAVHDLQSFGLDNVSVARACV